MRLLYTRSESWEGVGQLFLSRTLSPCSAFLIYGDVSLLGFLNLWRCATSIKNKTTF